MTEGNLEFEKPIQELEDKIADLEDLSEDSEINLSDELQRLRECLEQQKRITYANLSAWERVQIARNPRRPVISDYISLMLDDFMELYGDHKYRDDPSIVTGFAEMEGEKMMFMGHRRGKTTEERMECNFGSAHPEGYRKALHKMKIAEKYNLPVVSLINTPGAYPGIGAEERGQAKAIAENLKEMARLETPIICIVTGEGGSGGALGIGVGDYLSILENSFYSVISPEGCAAILWKDGDKAPEAAEALKLAPDDLKKHGIVDEVIPEPLGGAHRDPKGAADIIKSTILRYLDELKSYSTEELLEHRYQRYRKIGEYIEEETSRLSDQQEGGGSEEETEKTESLVTSYGSAGDGNSSSSAGNEQVPSATEDEPHDEQENQSENDTSPSENKTRSDPDPQPVTNRSEDGEDSAHRN